MSSKARRVRLPAGVRDYLPQAAARRRAIADALSEVFESWGFQRIITPVVEVAEVLDRGLGASDRDRAVRFVEPYTGQVLALRPDITPQIARIAATRMDGGGLPVRLSYEGAVTRLNPRAGGQREMLQAGVELIGVQSPDGDAEALAVAAAALAATRLGEYRLDLGHVAFSRFALQACPAGRREELTAALTRKDRSATRALARDLPRSARSIVEALPTLYGPRPEVCKRARGLRLPKALKAALAETEAVLELAASSMPAEVHDTISFDLGEVRGFDYYTGIRFRGFADGVGHAVLRGGRYDQLVGRYGRDAVATGFAIDVEAVAEAQDVVGIAAPAPARGLYLVVGPGKRRQANRVAASLRGLGHRVAVQVVAAARERNQARDRAVAGGWTHLLFWSDGWHGQGPTGEAAMTANVEAAASGRPAALSRWIRQGD